jgi:hypothetical protein
VKLKRLDLLTVDPSSIPTLLLLVSSCGEAGLPIITLISMEVTFKLHCSALLLEAFQLVQLSSSCPILLKGRPLRARYLLLKILGLKLTFWTKKMPRSRWTQKLSEGKLNFRTFGLDIHLSQISGSLKVSISKLHLKRTLP